MRRTQTKIHVGDFVLILEPPGYPDVYRGDLGKVVGNYWLKRDNTLNVDVISIREYVNLNFEPRQLMRVNESDLRRGRLPSFVSPERLWKQYEALASKDYSHSSQRRGL